MSSAAAAASAISASPIRPAKAPGFPSSRAATMFSRWERAGWWVKRSPWSTRCDPGDEQRHIVRLSAGAELLHPGENRSDDLLHRNLACIAQFIEQPGFAEFQIGRASCRERV